MLLSPELGAREVGGLVVGGLVWWGRGAWGGRGNSWERGPRDWGGPRWWAGPAGDFTVMVKPHLVVMVKVKWRMSRRWRGGWREADMEDEVVVAWRMT